jgi:hypothetical protein
MSETKNKIIKSKRLQAGIKYAITAGLPQVCPLLDIEKQTCKKTNEKLNNTLLCELDKDTNVDYRLCDEFSVWFWALAKQQENEAVQTEKTAIREHANLAEPRR